MRVTYAGIASFSAGFFLSFGFARSYYGAAPLILPAVPPTAEKVHPKKPVHEAAKSHEHKSEHRAEREPAAVAPLNAEPAPVRRKVALELAAPRFTSPSELKFNHKSGIFVRWNEVPNADAYQVTISDDEGRKVREYKTKRSFTLLKTLHVPPGKTQFTIRVAAVDSAKKQGPQSEAKRLLMEIMQESASEDRAEAVAQPAPPEETPAPPATQPAKHAAAPQATAPPAPAPVPAKIELKPPAIKSISTED